MRARIRLFLAVATVALAVAACGTPASAPASADVTPSPTPAGGPYRLTLAGLDAELTVSLPPGWDGDGSVVSRSSDVGDMAVSVWLVAGVYRDPCRWRGSETQVVTTAADVAAALESQPTRHARRSRVELAGSTAEFVTMSVPDVDLAACDDGELRSWTDAAGRRRTHDAPGQVDEVYVVDVNGAALVVDAAYSSDASTDQRAEVHRLVQSLQISLVAASPSASG